jgi:hypothetical protein
LLQLRLEGNGQTASQYVSYNRPATIALGNESVMVEFGQKRLSPGIFSSVGRFSGSPLSRNQPSGAIPERGQIDRSSHQIEEERLVYMNNPLAYNRFLVYQSGYEEGQNGRPDTSIFSIAWAPGTSTIYVGSIVLCLGMVLMFVNRRMPATASGNKA